MWRVDVTANGRALAADIAEVDEVLRAELRYGIGREERQALAWVMTRLQNNVDAAIDRTTHQSTISTPDSPTPDHS